VAGKNNRFKLFRDKTSLAKRNSRMLNGGDTEIKGNKLGWWERRPLQKNTATDIRITIPEVFSKRPDLLAFRVYRKSNLFWLVLQYNNIVDIEEEFITGKEILLPDVDRTLSSLVNRNIQKEPIEQ